MSKPKAQGVVEVPFDPVTERAFLAYFLAFCSQNQNFGFRYHPFVNFIFVPTCTPDAGAMFDFLHEIAHAQLQNGVLGLTLQSLQKLPAPIEKQLFHNLRNVLDTWSRKSQEDKIIYEDLFLYGELKRCPASSLAARLPLALLRDFRATMLGETFRSRWRVFRTVNERRQAIASRWHVVHEGFATFLSTRISSEDDDFSKLLLTRAVESLFPNLNPDSRKDLFRAVAAHAAQVKMRISQIRNARSVYTKGFQLLARIQEQHKSTFVTLVATLAASHFNYSNYPLLDAPRSEFDSWISSVSLNPHERLLFLAANPRLLQSFAEANLKENMVAPLMGKLLSEFPNYTPVDSRPFGEWAVANLWGSKLYAQAFTDSPLLLAGEATENYSRLFSENRSDTFAHGPIFVPTLLFQNGMVVQEDENVRRAFISNFVDCYEVGRTERLLGSLSSLCDITPPET